MKAHQIGDEAFLCSYTDLASRFSSQHASFDLYSALISNDLEMLNLIMNEKRWVVSLVIRLFPAELCKHILSKAYGVLDIYDDI